MKKTIKTNWLFFYFEVTWAFLMTKKYAGICRTVFLAFLKIFIHNTYCYLTGGSACFLLLVVKTTELISGGFTKVGGCK